MAGEAGPPLTANPGRIPRTTLLRVGLGGLALQAAFGPDRRQGLGLGAALSPLARLWPTKEERARFLTRQVRDYNTNPGMAGPLLGALANLEAAAAAGDGQAAERAEKLKRGVEAPFAAAGDMLLWGGIRTGAVVWGAVCAWFLGGWGPVFFLVVYNTVHLGLRVGGVFWGYRKGMEVSGLPRSPGFRRLVRLARLLVLSGAVGLGIVALAGEGVAGAAGLVAGALGLAAGSRGIARSTLSAVGVIIVGLILAYRLGFQSP